MKIHPDITVDKIINAAHRDCGVGFCVACGFEMEGGCEPDMRDGKCDACDEYSVYGAEELIFHFID